MYGISGCPQPPNFFHDLHGTNINLSSNHLSASKKTPGPNSYVFTERPVKLGQAVAIRVTGVIGGGTQCGLTLGMTSADPGELKQSDLPDSPDELLDRGEFWIVVEN